PDGYVTSAQVRIDAQPLVAWRPGWDYVRAQWQFYAPDPYRYGPTQTQTTGLPMDAGGLRYPLFTDGAGTELDHLDYGEYGDEGGVTLVNEGSALGWPRFAVAGPAPSGFTLTEMTTGRRLLYVGSIPSGSSVTLDSATGA